MPATTLLRDCSTLVTSIQEAGGKPPKILLNILDGAHLLATARPVSDPMHTIVAASVAGTLTADTLNELVEAAAHTQATNTYVGELRQRSERPFVLAFRKALAAGACDELLGTLRPIWDEHAAAIAQARSLLGSPESSVEHMLEGAGPGAVEAWQQLPEHVAVIERISAVARRFGPRLGDFPLITEAAHAENHKLEDAAIWCTDGSLTADSAALRRPGARRHSPWANVPLRLHSLGSARERYREFACSEWEAQHSGPRGGWVDEDGKIHEHPPLPNPYTDGDATVG